MPFIAVDVLRLVILCAFPALSLWLPSRCRERRRARGPPQHRNGVDDGPAQLPHQQSSAVRDVDAHDPGLKEVLFEGEAVRRPTG
jgi:hypothetical protein